MFSLLSGCAPSWSELVSGGDYTCVLDDEQRLRCWGQVYTVAGFSMEPEGTIHGLDAYAYALCGLDENDHAWCRGVDSHFNNVQESFDERPALSQVCTGGFFACGLLSASQTVSCWGYSSEGSGWLPAPEGLFDQITCGNDHACALDSDGQAWCWDPTNGMGDPPYQGQLEVPEVSFETIDAGSYHTCGIRLDGLVQCWGDSAGADAPGFKFKVVRAGLNDTCGLRTRDRIACWGAGDGSGSSADYGQAQPPDEKLVEVAVGRAHACGLTKHDELICWGDNTYGQLDIPLWWDR
ncbi:MAG: hypothetical protein H6739_15045 [Alphaproteobacteria bacterium]|nr:hypothetical protein [Alphaproteobacteria bacterium]